MSDGNKPGEDRELRIVNPATRMEITHDHSNRDRPVL